MITNEHSHFIEGSEGCSKKVGSYYYFEIIRIRYNIQHPQQLKRLVKILMNNSSRLLIINKLKQCLAREQNKLSFEEISNNIDKSSTAILFPQILFTHAIGYKIIESLWLCLFNR